MRSCLFAAMVALSGAQAQAADNPPGYLLTSADGSPIIVGHGGCVRTGQWSPSMSYRQCDSSVVAMAAPAGEVSGNPLFRISMDTLFDFDSAVLKADAGLALNKLARQLAEADYQTVAIVGHADRIGSARRNQRLSEQRAEAVGNYLAAQGVQGSRISSSGVGSSEPVTGSQCDGLKGKHLISCLGPDRYAGVTVTGTQTSAMRR